MHLAQKAAWTLATVLAAGSIALIAATARLPLWPETDSPTRADAVVVLAGGQGERLTKALELMHADTAPALVIANGDDPKWPGANRLCNGTSSFELICFRPDPDNTWRGARTWLAGPKPPALGDHRWRAAVRRDTRSSFASLTATTKINVT